MERDARIIKLLTPLLFLILLSKKPVVATTSSLQDHGVRCLDSERLALLEFKNGLKHPGQLHTWGTEEHKKDCCKWKGILCDNHTNHVVELNLRDIELGKFLIHCGNISEALGNLVSLSYLDLSGHRFQGKIPDTFGNLTYLSHLDLSNNRLEGAIPDSLGNLMHLSHLDLSENQLEDGIPHTFGNLTSLSHLYMSFYNLNFNQESGWLIPEALGNLESLSVLDLTSTKLKGRIPDALGNLTSLVYLDLSVNGLQGRIPDSIGNLRSLSNLHLPLTSLKIVSHLVWGN
ncbi:uncharacterized protein [Henckelia pumila]|uniref:uncharacterized protein n=1 Tax=Henckelia pumila TaxID=405737 RepID=UPI003C6E2108